jgi:hypothetical protein
MSRNTVLEFFECAQYSREWYRCRLGLPTASQFAAVLAKGKGAGGASLTRRRYLLTLAAEIVTGEPASDCFTNPAIERGRALEEEARRAYAFVHDAEPRRVGFIRNGMKGCSPDALLGSEGLLEIKSKRGDLLIELLLRGEFPQEHKAQTQGALWVAERDWIDLACYWPGLPLFVKRCYRDEPYIGLLAAAVDRFNAELADIVERVSSYSARPPSSVLTIALGQSLAALS